MAACTVDDVLSKIGQFGRAQKRFYVMIGFVQFTMACQYFLVSFAEHRGLDWDCVSTTDHHTRFDHATVTLEERCRLLDSGQCFPEYASPDVTIVTEVCYVVCSSLTILGSVCLLSNFGMQDTKKR